MWSTETMWTREFFLIISRLKSIFFQIKFKTGNSTGNSPPPHISPRISATLKLTSIFFHIFNFSFFFFAFLSPLIYVTVSCKLNIKLMVHLRNIKDCNKFWFFNSIVLAFLKSLLSLGRKNINFRLLNNAKHLNTIFSIRGWNPILPPLLSVMFISWG